MEALIKSGLCKSSLCRQEEVEQLSRDGSHYSLSTGILPSLGGKSTRRVKLRRFIISPYDRRYRCNIIYFLVLFLFCYLHSYIQCLVQELYCFYWFVFCVIWLILLYYCLSDSGFLLDLLKFEFTNYFLFPLIYNIYCCL